MNSTQFLNALCAIKFEHTFNPYADRCPIHDAPDAPKVRSRTLLAMLQAAGRTEIDSIWIGRDLGYRGGRRTGLALTDDVHIQAHVARWGISAKRPTRGEVIAERTAAVVWGILSHIQAHVFLWNVFPLHPHESNDPFTNRTHNSKEREAGEEILFQLITFLKPRRLVAIGNNAAVAASRLNDTCELIQVRHPSYGGQTEFLEQMRKLYELRDDTHQQSINAELPF